MFVSDNGASAEGGPTGSVNENKFFNNVPDDARSRTCGASTSWAGPKYFNHYSWGWTLRRQHAVPPLEARDLSRRRQRPVHRPLAEGDQGEGRDPHAVRPRHRHGADRARGAGHRSRRRRSRASRSRRSRASASRTSFDDAKAPTRHITQYFEMFGHRSIYHDGWRAVCPWPGTSFAEAGLALRRADRREDKLTELRCASAGSSINVAEDSRREPTTWPPDNRDKLIEMIGTWYVEAGKYNVLPIDSRGTLRFAEPRPQIAVDRKSYTYYPGTQTVPGNAAVRCSTGRTASPPTSRFRRGRRRRAALARAATTAASRSTSRTASCTTRTTTSRTRNYHLESKDQVPAGRHKLRFEFEVTGKPDVAKGLGAPGRVQLYVDGTLVAQMISPRRFRCRWDWAAA